MTEYKGRKRVARIIPFGYEVDPDNDRWLLPIPSQLDALNQAYKLIRQGCSYREVANWLSATTGRKHSYKNLWANYRRVLKARHGKRYNNSATPAEEEINSNEG